MVLTLGNLVGYYRSAQDMSQRELARMVKISHVQIANIENNKHEPGIYTAQAIAEALGTTTDILFWREEREDDRH